jgi:hypothetical protein
LLERRDLILLRRHRVGRRGQTGFDELASPPFQQLPHR